jgi:thioredoxin-related protein
MIINLNEENKDNVEFIIKKHNNVIIFYYSNMCYYCNILKPIWRNLCMYAKNTKDVVIINVESNNIKHLNKNYKDGLSGYPTILKYCKGKKNSEYTGERNLPDLKKFVEK